MPRKNLEVTIVGGATPRVPDAPKVETPASPAPTVDPTTPGPPTEEDTKPGKPAKKGKGKS